MTKINRKARDLMLFMSLGDGHIDRCGAFTLIHCAKQKEYIEYKQKLLRSCGIKTSECELFDNSGYAGYRFRTKSYSFSKVLRRILYKPKKNIANRKLLNRLTALGLAI